MANAYLLGFISWVLLLFASISLSIVWDFRYKYVLSFFLFIVFSTIIIWLSLWEAEQRYASTHLVPGHSKIDELPICEGFKSEFSIFLGSVEILVSQFPETVLAVGERVDGKPFPVLEIDRVDHKVILKTFRIFDEDGKTLITTFDEDEWWKNSNFNVKKITDSQIVARNSQGDIIMDMNYLSANSLKITGKFFHGTAGLELGEKTNISYPTRGVDENLCFVLTNQRIPIYIDSSGNEYIGFLKQ